MRSETTHHEVPDTIPPRSVRERGITYVEIMISLVLLSVAFAAVTQISLRSSRALSSLSVRAHLSTRAQVVMNRVSQEIISASFVTQTPPMADDSPTLRFQKVVGFASGVPVLGEEMQVDLVAAESDSDDDSDNDGDGLIDEMTVRIWTDFAPTGTSPGNEDEVWTSDSAIAKDGLSFTRIDGIVTFDLTLQGVSDPGEPAVTFTRSTAVRMRND